jgi:hypothetical protein
MLPLWTMEGVLPAVWPGQPGHSTLRSPYITDLAQIVQRFATSPKRIEILQGLFSFRAELHKHGIRSGFQWLDGSFMEHVEALETRDPKDIDAVTYFDLPVGETEESLDQKASHLFDHDGVKEAFHVDHYPVVLGGMIDADSIREISYWYSMWSHRRNGTWKGFVQVDLDPSQDAAALPYLPVNSGGTP